MQNYKPSVPEDGKHHKQLVGNYERNVYSEDQIVDCRVILKCI